MSNKQTDQNIKAITPKVSIFSKGNAFGFNNIKNVGKSKSEVKGGAPQFRINQHKGA